MFFGLVFNSKIDPFLFGWVANSKVCQFYKIYFGQDKSGYFIHFGLIVFQL